MQDEGEIVGASSNAFPATRLEMLDVPGAILAAERIAGTKVLGDPTENGEIARTFAEAFSTTEKGERAAVIAPSERIASMRDTLRRFAAARTGFVAHAIAGTGAEDIAAFADLGWGILSASGPEDSFDLTLVARRASEDSGVPFIVVHGLARPASPAGRAVAMTALPTDAAVERFIGARGRSDLARATTGDRAFAERAPFALGSALREYSSVSGRRHDVLDKMPLGESPLVLVGSGPVGDALLSATSELRARGHDVGAINITALRPFPGPRLVKALARALAITVLEPADEPFAHGGFLARDVKSAFTDALTWVPGFPGIGRIPKLFVGASGSSFDLEDLVAVCENMLADERGRRVFSLHDVEHTLPRSRAEIPPSVRSKQDQREREVAIRFVVDDTASAEAILSSVAKVLAEGIGLRTHGIVVNAGPCVVVDVIATRDSARGGMARRTPRLVLATARGAANAGAVVALADGAVLGVLGAESPSALPEAARTIIRERRVRALPLAIADGSAGAIAAVAAAAALAVASRLMRSPVDSAFVDGPHAAAASRAFEATRDTLAAASPGGSA